MKVKTEIIKKGKTYMGEKVDFINYELTKSTCPECKKEWLSLYLNGLVVFGGSSTIQDGKSCREMCSECSRKEIWKIEE